MSSDPLYITPHETALAVIATSMKKSRLTLQTLIINSIMGGLFFSAGGMLYCIAKGNNPVLETGNPGILSMLGGMNFSIGLFYVIINGCDLFNSNILFFTVGWLRGAVSIFDLIVSWTISWIFNLGSSLFVSYVICHLSGVMKEEFLKKGTIEIAEAKMGFHFIETFIKGIAGNFCVCLAVYLQLMSKPIHVKFLTILLPIYTFVTCGFTHIVADMFLIPTGMFNGANISVATFIWKNLIPASLGNIVGGTFFSLVIPFYLHLYVVEQDRKQLNLPEYDAVDDRPEINVDSQVVRVKSRKEEDDDSFVNEKRTHESMNPPGVFPIRGMRPLLKEKSIMSRDYVDEAHIDDEDSDSSDKIDDNINDYNTENAIPPPEPYFANTTESLMADNMSNVDSLDLENQKLDSRRNLLQKIKTKEKLQEDQFDKTGRYNPEKNKLGTKLEKIFTSSKKTKDQKNNNNNNNNSNIKSYYPVDNQYQPAHLIASEPAYQSSANQTNNNNNINNNLPYTASRRSSLASSRASLSTRADIKKEFQKQNMTNKALRMADPVAGSADLDDSFVRRPSRLRYQHSSSYYQRPSYDNDNMEEQSIGD